MPVEILFCDRCHESIPDVELENGKSIRVGGKALHVGCAFRRALPGPGRALTFVLALLGAGGAAFAVSRVLRAPAAPSATPVGVVRADLDAAVAQVRADAERALTEQRKTLQSELDRAVAAAREDGARAYREAVANLEGRVEAYANAHLRRFEATDRQLAELAGFVKEVRDLAARSGGATPPAPAPGPAPAPAPAAPTPAPAAPAPTAPAPAPVDVEAQKRRDAELDRWVKLLKDPDPGVSYSATYKLKELKDLRAVPALVETLRAHKDYYTRLGAATALGELKACDGVGSLVEALDDKEELVQTAASEALAEVTGRESKSLVGLTKKERKAVKDDWAKWWKENEAAVRTRLGQDAPKAP